ncbi:MAG: TrkA family potassium uptake protein [Cyanobacteriota bacterium]|nr:TrkA family potassium uptake protein [Cyanobacteriota bacterium]
MRVIIVGDSKLVYFLAKQFISKGDRVTLIASDREIATEFSRQLKATVTAGDASDPDILEQVGAIGADILVALTPEDPNNLIACQIAQKQYGVPQTVALVNDPENKAIFEQLGVTVAFSATELIAQLIEQQTGSEALENIVPIASGRLNVIEIVVGVEMPAARQTLGEFNLPPKTSIACILRGGETIAIDAETFPQPGDRLIVVSPPECYGQLMRSLTGEV